MANQTLIALGKARLKVVGLNPQGIQSNSEGRVPGRATFNGMDHQLTGLGEKITAISAITYPKVTGGLDALGWLQRHHEQQDVINYLRMGANWRGQMMGTIVITTLEEKEDQIHPFTGVGRKVEVELELKHVGPGINANALSGSFFGGLLNVR